MDNKPNLNIKTAQDKTMVSPAFVVGTGRCGSTLVSNMLNLHTEILSLSEFFAFITDLGTLIPEAFPNQEISAAQFWSIISTAYTKQNIMLKHDVVMKEVLYPYKSTSSRFSAEIGVPAILQTTLPHLTPEHDSLFTEIETFLTCRPAATIQQHYRTLFDWLAKRFECNMWIERSGGSLRIIQRLYENFPDAKFIHIVRDGRDCALSMQKHYGFRMVLLVFQLLEVLGIDPFESEDRSLVDDLPDDLVHFLPENFDANEFRNYEVSPSLYGHYWSGEIITGMCVFENIPLEQVLMLRYEDFLSKPETSVSELITFLDSNFIDNDWIKQATAIVNKPKSSWQQLPQREKNLLEQACLPGFKVLSQYGLSW